MSNRLNESIYNYTVQYTLKEKEFSKLMELLAKSENGYSAFLITLIKELGGDINKVLRVLNVGVKSETKIFNVSLLTHLVALLKESIILTNYKDYIKEDGFISVVQIAKNIRFEMAGINRQNIIRTFKKHGIEYNYKK